MAKRRGFILTSALALVWTVGLAVPAAAEVPANDSVAGATVLSIPDSTGPLDFSEAGVDAGEDTTCGGWEFYDPRTLWYAFVPTTDLTLRVVAESQWGAGPPGVALYTGTPDALTPFTCLTGGQGTVDVSGGTTLYLQVISPFGYQVGSLTIEQVIRPANDTIGAAFPLSVGQAALADITNAALTNDEPSCPGEWAPATVWYAFTAPESVAYQLTFEPDPWDQWRMVSGVYTRSGDMLTQVGGCGAGFVATKGLTYYVQVGKSRTFTGEANLTISTAPAPAPSVTVSEYPSQYSPAYLSASGYDDPLGWQYPVNLRWDLGDGTTVEGEGSIWHQYAADGDYTVTFSSTTADGRVGTASVVVKVRTHDVAVVSLSAPVTARAGQVKSFTVGLRNTRYGEDVTLLLSKGTRDGWVEVARTTQYLPARPANKTSSIVMPYVFTTADASQGSVSFRVEAFMSVPDAFGVNNTMVSAPVRVTK